MPIHVYECRKSDVERLKKLLSYDPYLDPSVIPPSSPGSDKPPERQTEDERKMAAERDQKVREAMERLKQDKYSDVIFARQEYEILDGAAFGEPDVSYLYIKATDEFLSRADEALEHKLGIKRAAREAEEKVLAKVSSDEASGNAGFGSIFG